MVGQTGRLDIQVRHTGTEKMLDRFVRQTGTGPETDRQTIWLAFLLITAVIIELV